MKRKDLEEGIHYYLDKGRVVFTALFHQLRGECCGNGCRHCPYDPIHKKGTKKIDFNIIPEDNTFKEKE